MGDPDAFGQVTQLAIQPVQGKKLDGAVQYLA